MRAPPGLAASELVDHCIQWSINTSREEEQYDILRKWYPTLEPRGPGYPLPVYRCVDHSFSKSILTKESYKSLTRPLAKCNPCLCHGMFIQLE